MRTADLRSQRPLLLTALAACAVLVAADASAFALLPFGAGAGERIWPTALAAFSLGIVAALLLLQLRSRAVADAVRRLIDLVVAFDGGRFPEPTRRRSVEAELDRLSYEIALAAQHSARLRAEAEQRRGTWDAAFGAAFDALFVLDGRGRIVQMNAAAEKLFRVRADDWTGRSLPAVMLPRGHRSLENAAFATDLADGRLTTAPQELVARRGDGRQFPIEIAVACFGSGELRGSIAVVRDLTLLRRLRAELERVRDESARTESRWRAEVARLGPAPEGADAAAEATLDEGAPCGAAPADEASEEATGQAALDLRVLDPVAPAEERIAPITVMSFTVENVCGDLVRRLARRAERRGIGFRYEEDGALAGMQLLGDTLRLRRVLINLIDHVVKSVEAGEIVVHLAGVAGDGREVDLAIQVTATMMSEAQANRMLKPYVTETVTREGRGYPGRAVTRRSIDFYGAALEHAPSGRTGRSFGCHLRFEADLSEVAIDLYALPDGGAPRDGAEARGPGHDPARVHQEFLRSATRLRSQAEKPNLSALWAEAHRLKDAWQRHGGKDDVGLVSALAYAARGGDAPNAVLLAHRLAVALEEAARLSSPPPQQRTRA